MQFFLRIFIRRVRGEPKTLWTCDAEMIISSKYYSNGFIFVSHHKNSLQTHPILIGKSINVVGTLCVATAQSQLFQYANRIEINKIEQTTQEYRKKLFVFFFPVSFNRHNVRYDWYCMSSTGNWFNQNWTAMPDDWRCVATEVFLHLSWLSSVKYFSESHFNRMKVALICSVSKELVNRQLTIVTKVKYQSIKKEATNRQKNGTFWIFIDRNYCRHYCNLNTWRWVLVKQHTNG